VTELLDARPSGRPADADVDVDVLLVGAGPAGLYGAYYAGFRGLRVAVMDLLPQPGGQVAALYPEKPIFDVAGWPSVRGRELIANLVAQASPYAPVYLLGEQAATLRYDTAGAPVVGTSSGRTVRAGAVVITGGVGTFRPRPLTVAEPFAGRGLAYFVPRLSDYAGLDVVVVGGGDSAFDWALHLEPLARSVTLVHRRQRFRAARTTVEQVRASTVTMLLDSELTRVDGGERLEAVEVHHVPDGTRQTRPAQAVVAALGFTADLGPLESWGLALSARRLVVDTRMATNLPRVYAAGDITDYPGKVRLISVGFGEVATAVNNAAVVLDPTADLFPGHSTEREA
jgi:thioredoxin reductase (NADPH)